MKNKAYFVTGTDTDVGKTVVTFALGVLLKNKGLDVGVMKPIQCAGQDASFLKKNLGLEDSLKSINPYFAPDPVSPHVAFKRQKKKININKIIATFKDLSKRHDVLLVEGAGGLLVPIKDNYLVADLIKDLDLDLIIVSRLGLGTINHTLLTISQARQNGIKVKGVLFNQASSLKPGIPEKTNPDAIRKCGNVSVLGTIPFLRNINSKEVLKKCKENVDVNRLLKTSSARRTKELKEWDKEYVWHPFTQMQDWLKEEHLVIDQADGCYLIDTQGNRYLDGVSSLWVNVHGHRNKKISQAICNQTKKLNHSTLLGLASTPSVELAKRLVEITPHGLDKVFYSDSGSTAVEIALKMSYQYWQNIGQKHKKDIVHISNSYHGDTLGSVSVGGIDLFHKVYRNLIFKSVGVDFPDCYRAPRGKEYPDYAFECVDKIEEIFKKSHETIASFIVEPIVQGAGGMIVWPKGILKRLAELCKRYNILLIADEVATGFGRTGKMFACEHEGVTPDLMCLAKGITGGFLPLAATLTTKKLFEGFLFDYKEKKTFFHGHTYTGNPLCCAAALANVEVFKKEKTLQKLQSKIEFVRKRLEDFSELRYVGDVRQKGFMVGIELVKDRRTKEPFPWGKKVGVRVCQKVREKGVILRPLGNVVVLMPPLTITKKELKYLLDVTCHAIKEVAEGI